MNHLTVSRVRVDRDRLKSALIRYREDHLMPRYGDHDRRTGILRRNMLDALLDNRPESIAEFLQLIPHHLLAATDRQQLRNEVDAICRIIRRL